MLTAMKEDGTPFYLVPRISKNDLRKEREKENFYCPECQGKLILKIGSKRMEHFAHQQGSSCMEGYERESEYHLNGKLQMYHWLEDQNLNPLLEPYNPSIQQRPDIGVNFDRKNYAIEFQCSTIPLELMKNRTRNYQKRKVTPIWILGGKTIKRKGEKKVTLSHFESLFLMKDASNVWVLPAYCSKSQLFIHLINITPITSKKALADILITPIQSNSFPDLINPLKQNSLKNLDWKREIQNQKVSIQLYGNHQNEFLKYLYYHSLHLSLLPPYIGLPVKDALIIETPPLIWQLYFCIDHLLNNQESGTIITFHQMYKGFMDRIKKRDIVLRDLPLAPNSSPVIPLIGYIHLLIQFQVIEAINTNTFRLKKPLQFPGNVMEQQMMEDHFYQQLSESLFSYK